MKQGIADTMSDNPLDELQGDMGEDSGMAELTKYHYKWTLADEAIHRGNNYAEKHAKAHLDAVRYKEATMYAILKNAYQEGFMHGFEHKFDDNNYEEK